MEYMLLLLHCGKHAEAAAIAAKLLAGKVTPNSCWPWPGRLRLVRRGGWDRTGAAGAMGLGGEVIQATWRRRSNWASDPVYLECGDGPGPTCDDPALTEWPNCPRVLAVLEQVNDRRRWRDRSNIQPSDVRGCPESSSHIGRQAP
ncbi:MAG: hypothetical protein U0797_04935 [Gemmataceae bacterium]